MVSQGRIPETQQGACLEFRAILAQEMRACACEAYGHDPGSATTILDKHAHEAC